MNVLSVPLSFPTRGQLLALVDAAIRQREQVVIASQNVHGLYMYLTNEGFRALHERNHTVRHVEGTPLLWAARAAGLRVTYRHRTRVISWIGALLKQAERNRWRVFHLGGGRESLRRALLNVRRGYPLLDINGREGYFDARLGSRENAAAVKAINDAQSHILLVGMGMGRQETWIAENMDDLGCDVIVTTGSCIRFLAGELKIAPEWLGRLGLEWLYRLQQDPTVFKRYLLEPFALMYLLPHSKSIRRGRTHG